MIYKKVYYVSVCIIPCNTTNNLKFMVSVPYPAVGRGVYCDNLGVIDFYLSELCPVVYINESELISGVSFEAKLRKVLQVWLWFGVCVCVCVMHMFEHKSSFV